MQLDEILDHTRVWRRVMQWGILLWCLFIGVQFGLFVAQLEAGGQVTYLRPPSVEGFLPIGSLMAIRHWFISGEIHGYHPAGVVLMVTFIIMSLLAKKSFCSFICPVGTLSEQVWRGGRKLFGRNFKPWKWLDILLRSGKYLLLYFFINITFFRMPARALKGFLDGTYWAASDIKMLEFFTDMSLLAMAILAALVLLSLPFKNFWCRYLCPYGALVGLVSMASPWKIRRTREHCTYCGKCSSACPSYLPVGEKRVIRSPECTGCLSCVSACPEGKALAMSPPGVKGALPARLFPAFVLLVYMVGIGAGMLSGNWQTSLTESDYRGLIKITDRLSH
jgi:polyferredoxin